MRRILRFALAALGLLIVLTIGGGLYLRAELRASLPMTNGTHRVPGMTSPATVRRDSLGVPTITAASRADAARALGFVHAQDRFFQMDLQRRQPAGELAELVGARALDVDAQTRVHRFRRVAREAYERADPNWRGLLDAYAEGVNAGLAALGAPPFEYLMLRTSPEAWRAEDSILTVLAMFNTLQGRQASFEQAIGTLRDSLPDAMFRFVAAPGSDWESPVVGVPLARPPTPGADVFDLRHRRASGAPAHRRAPRGGDGAATAGARLAARAHMSCDAAASWSGTACVEGDEAAIIGSNNWAVDASNAADGGALLANDMHLAIGVPNIWYRAAIVVPDPDDPASPSRIAGVTLPGLPSIVVGSNGHVAWGFTNSGGDWSDLVRVETDPRDRTKYLTPDGPKAFDVAEEVVTAKSAESRRVSVRSTIWGPIVAKDAAGRDLAQRWVAHDPDVLKSDLTRPERARSVDELLAAVAGLGIPNQNVTVADRDGRIGWTIGGAIPKRVGLSGFTPESWADGTRRWDGYLAPADFPRIVDPERGRIWTANAPVVGDAALAVIGEGGYADGIRARIIRDRLMAIGKATPRDLLDVQLDNRALFLDRWRDLALKALATATDPKRVEFRSLLASTWTGMASPDSVAYRLTRTFRASLVREVMLSLTEPAREAESMFDYTRTLRGEGPVWQLLAERPAHLLAPTYATWDDCILAAIDRSIAELTASGRRLADRSWGEANRAQVQHPLASAVPLLPRWLNMPEDPLPGDVYTPRAHSPRAGPSERMVVSPGREEHGILHMPTGQSGHPLSSHYADMHSAWVAGEVVPFLPGATVATLRLTPVHAR